MTLAARARKRAVATVQVGGVRAVVVFSDRPRRLADWYCRAFAATELVASEGFIGLSLGEVSLFVQQTSEGYSPGMGGVRPHFDVADCQGSFRQLIAAGAKPVLPPVDAGDEWIAAVKDPEGNPLGLLQQKR